jgi:hypothetical protein
LHAFERVCHDARAASRRGIPHIERTPRGEARFYHLDVSVDGSSDPLALLVADRAGEEYLEAANDVSLAIAFNEVKRADAIIVLVDGSKLIDIRARHNAQSDVKQMLQALIEANAFQEGQRLALVLTKFDLIDGDPNGQRAQTDFERVVSQVKVSTKGIFSEVSGFRIAASPQQKAKMRGSGVAGLLRYCLISPTRGQTEVQSAPALERSFAALSRV